MSEEKKWKLDAGCHRGTVTTRDSIVKKYGSLEECESAFAEMKESWRKSGYSVWYARAKGPDGEDIKLDAGVPYRY